MPIQCVCNTGCVGAFAVYGHPQVSYAVHMTTKGTPGRMIRVDEETWTAYGEAVKAKGLTRTADLRVHMIATIKAHQRQVRAEQRADQADT